MRSLLFVCLGNICRSPAAEGVARAMAASRGMQLRIASAGTGAWHVGASPDDRMMAAAKRRGYDLSAQRARAVDLSDFYEFDMMLAMDLRNFDDLLSMSPPNRSVDIRLFLDFAPGDVRETPDPYYGGAQGFEHVLDLVEEGVEAVLDHLENESG